MSDLKDAAQELSKAGASKGGRARASSLSAAERQAIARHAAAERWHRDEEPTEQEHDDIPQATHSGQLKIVDLVLPCAVLDNGMRVLSERGVTKALGGKRGGAHWRRKRTSPNGMHLPVYISAGNLAAFIPSSLTLALEQPIRYRFRNGRIGNGVVATLLPEICDVWLKARRAGALHPTQEHIAAKAEILVLGLANVGIVALVDEATGYQEVRDRNELHRILEAYISKELLPWAKRFPDEFYQELFRLRRWEYSPPQPKRPKLVGKLTSEIVYEKLPPGVLQELRNRNPVIKNGWRQHKHHQFLTEDIGHPHLEKHIVALLALMRASPGWATFKRLLGRAFPTHGVQYEFDLELDDED